MEIRPYNKNIFEHKDFKEQFWSAVDDYMEKDDFYPQKIEELETGEQRLYFTHTMEVRIVSLQEEGMMHIHYCTSDVSQCDFNDDIRIKLMKMVCDDDEHLFEGNSYKYQALEDILFDDMGEERITYYLYQILKNELIYEYNEIIAREIWEYFLTHNDLEGQRITSVDLRKHIDDYREKYGKLNVFTNDYSLASVHVGEIAKIYLVRDDRNYTAYTIKEIHVKYLGNGHYILLQEFEKGFCVTTELISKFFKHCLDTHDFQTATDLFDKKQSLGVWRIDPYYVIKMYLFSVS
jgi:hypothetical protein